MLELLSESQGTRRACLHAQSAESTHPQVINVLVDNAFRFSVFAGDPGRNDLYRSVGAVVFTYPAAGAAMQVMLIMGHDHFAFESFRHCQLFPVLRILLCDDLPGTEEIPACDRHSCQQGFHPVGNICKILKEAVHSKLKMPVH